MSMDGHTACSGEKAALCHGPEYGQLEKWWHGVSVNSVIYLLAERKEKQKFGADRPEHRGMVHLDCHHSPVPLHSVQNQR